MRGGERLEAGRRTLAEAREHAARERERLPASLRGLQAPAEPYPVEVSAALQAEAQALRDELRGTPNSVTALRQPLLPRAL